jgi:hypothetical protein
MGRRLNTNVNVEGTWYGPHTAVPAHVAEQITNPKVWTGDTEPEPEPTVAKQPPRKGPGSGGSSWVEFAASKGVTQPFDSKEQLIGYLEDNGHIDKG